MNYQQCIESGKRVTLKAIVEALASNDWDVLYFSSEEQISQLIEAGRIDEDFASRHFQYAEEMSVMMGAQA